MTTAFVTIQTRNGPQRLPRACFSRMAAGDTGPNPQLVKQLTELGFDVSTLPADSSDELLNAILALVQTTNPPAANGKPNPPATQQSQQQNAPPVRFSDVAARKAGMSPVTHRMLSGTPTGRAILKKQNVRPVTF